MSRHGELRNDKRNRMPDRRCGCETKGGCLLAEMLRI
jgi:hypothetical protein